jgi:hypothetical protein
MHNNNVAIGKCPVTNMAVWKAGFSPKFNRVHSEGPSALLARDPQFERATDLGGL